MIITKFGHCCMLVEEGGVRIVTDPGVYSTQQNQSKDIHAILITHEHADHCHMDSVKAILKNNPRTTIITNKSVGIFLEKEGITYRCIEDGGKTEINGVSVEGYGTKHAPMHASVPQNHNTGYFIANKLFYPGDAFTNPTKPIEILALPVAGPWMKLAEAIDYALQLKPKICFPVHDGILLSAGITNTLPQQILQSQGIDFRILELDKGYEF